MASDTIIAKLPQNEFFAVIPSGFYAFSAIFAAATVDDTPSASLWTMLGNLAKIIHDNPVLLVFLLFGSYMLGSVFRAVPVRWIERTIPPFKDRFPYPKEIAGILTALHDRHDIACVRPARLPAVEAATSPRVFNYWKDSLCIGSPEGFAYYQSFETRVRLFAGTLCAAAAGVICALVMFARTRNPANEAALAVLALSGSLFVVFAANFRSIRQQESSALTMLFVAMLQEQPSLRPPLRKVGRRRV